MRINELLQLIQLAQKEVTWLTVQYIA